MTITSAQFQKMGLFCACSPTTLVCVLLVLSALTLPPAGEAADLEVTVFNEYGSTVEVDPTWVRPKDAPFVFGPISPDPRVKPKPVKNVGQWRQCGKTDARVLVTITSVDDPSVHRTEPLQVGKKTVLLSGVRPGTYRVTASTVVQYTEPILYDTQIMTQGTMQTWKPVPLSGWTKDKGQWCLVEFQGVRDTGPTYEYRLVVRYTYISSHDTYTVVDSDETKNSKSGPDHAVVFLQTDKQKLGKVAGNGKEAGIKTEIGRFDLPDAVKNQVVDDALSNILAKGLVHEWPKLGAKHGSLLAGTLVNIVSLAKPDPTLDLDLRRGRSAVSFIVLVTTLGGPAAVVTATGIGTGLVTDWLVEALQEERVKRAVTAALYDDVKARIIRKDGVVTNVELFFGASVVATPGLVNVLGSRKYGLRFAELPICTTPGTWTNLAIASQPPLSVVPDAREMFTDMLDNNAIEVYCDYPISEGSVIQDVRWKLRDLVVWDKTLLHVPYFNQHGTKWCFFHAASMLLTYYKPLLRESDHSERPWEIAADPRYHKASDELFDGKDVLLHDLADYINDRHPGLKAKSSKTLLWSSDIRYWLQLRISKGQPVILGRGSPFSHAVLVVGTCPGGVWVHNPGDRSPMLPFSNSSEPNGISSFLTWEEFQELFVDGPSPRYTLYCDVDSKKTNGDAISLGRLGIRFAEQDNPMADGLQLVFDGRDPRGYRWVSTTGITAVPQKNAAVSVQCAFGNTTFDKKRHYSITAQIFSSTGKELFANHWGSGRMDPGGYCELSLLVKDKLIPLPESEGGTERIVLVLRNELGKELDRCSFTYRRQRPSEGMLDIVILIDKSGSMIDDMQAVQTQVDSMLGQLGQLVRKERIRLQVGLVLFRYDNHVNQFEVNRLSPDIESTRRFIQKLDPRDVSGDEDLFSAAMYAMNQPVEGKQIDMGWRPQAAKIMIPITDEPPKDDNFNMAQVARVAEELDPVHMYPLVVPKGVLGWLIGTERTMERLASMTNGKSTTVQDANDVPAAIVDVVMLAIQRHREEIWRQEHPPYGLYGVLAALATLALCSLMGIFVRQLWQRHYAVSGTGEASNSPLAPTLTGETPRELIE